MARRNSGVISRNSGVISRNSGVISRNSEVFFWTESSAGLGFDFEKVFHRRVLTGATSSATLLGGRPEASFKETLRSIRIMESNPLCKKNTLETRLQRKMSSLPHAPWFLLGSLCFGTSCLYFVMVIRKMGEGNGNGKVRVCSRRTTRGAKAISSCMIQPFIISVFQNLGSGFFSGLRRFFRNPVENFAGLRSGTSFRPKEDPGIIYYSFTYIIIDILSQLATGALSLQCQIAKQPLCD